MNKALGILIAIVVVVLWGTFSAAYTLDANEQAVVLRLGKYNSTTAVGGLQFKIPFGIDEAYKVRTEYEYKAEFGFRTVSAGKNTNYNKSGFVEESEMLTGDLNIVYLQWVVQYKINDPYQYLFATRNPEELLRDGSESVMRLMVGDRSFYEVLQKDRVAIANTAKTHLQDMLTLYECGIIVELVQLKTVDPPPLVQAAFKEVNSAEQTQETTINEAREDYTKQVTETEGEAARLVEEANGYAIERVNEAKGNTAWFTAVYNEYKVNPKVTKDRLYFETMQKILPTAENVWFIDENISALPHFNLGGN